MSPNLLPHGPLVTTEIPIVAALMTAMSLFFWMFLRTGDRRALRRKCGAGGAGIFSCKFTAVVAPPIFGILWMISRWIDGGGRMDRVALRVAAGMAAFVAIMGATDLIITGGAMLPISEQAGNHPSFAGRLGPAAVHWIGRAIETPIPQDWAGFVRQTIMQRSGGPSYLFGQVRESGWRYYYLVALAVKVPLILFLAHRGPPVGPGAADSLGRARLDPPGRRSRVPGLRIARVVAQPGRPVHAADRSPGHRLDLGTCRGEEMAEPADAWGGLAAQAVAVASIPPLRTLIF